MLNLANEIRNELVAQGLVAADGPCYVEPEKGTPSPFDIPGDEDACIGISYATSEPTLPLQGYREVRILDIEVRGRDSKTGLELADQIAYALDDKIHEQIGDLLVQTCRVISQPRRVSWRYTGQGATFALTVRVGVVRADYGS